MLIKFRCPVCHHKLRADSVHAGKRAACSKCKQPLTVPAASTVNGDDKTPLEEAQFVEPVESSAALATPQAAGPATEDDAARAPVSPVTPLSAPGEKSGPPAFITFDCPGCGKRIGFPAHLPGTPANCPACHLLIMIPDRPGGESFIVGNVAARAPNPQPEIHNPQSSGRPTPRAALQSVGRRDTSVPPRANVAPAEPRAHGPRVMSSDFRRDPSAAGQSGRAPRVRRRPAVLVLLAAGIVLLSAIAFGGPWLKAFLNSAVGTKTEGKPAAPLVAPARTPAPAEAKAPPAAADEPKAAPQAPPAAPAEADSAAFDPLEPVEIRLAPGAAPAARADLAALLTLQDRKQSRADEDDVEEPPAKAKSKPERAGGGLEKQLDNLTTPQPEAKPAEPEPAPVIAARAAPAPLPCETCMGTKFVPRLPFTPYVHLEKDAPNPAAAVPWQHCPQCQRGRDNAVLLQSEVERLKTALDAHRKWGAQTHQRLAYAETHQVALHAQLAEGTLRRVADTLEKLAAHLEQTTLTTVLCQTRPGTHDLVILSDPQGFVAFRAVLPRRGDTDERFRQSVTIVQGMTPPVENMALFRLGRMLMAEATDGRAPAWLMEGFAGYCEYAVTHRNLNYPLTPAADPIRPGESWSAGLKRLAAQGKLPSLGRTLNVSRMHMMPTDYAASYSLVDFLFRSKPRDFVRFVLEVRGAVQAPEAIERVYGPNTKELQVLWAQWVAKG